ncbi:MAG: urate hydroxylase PuuD [Gammaproteobacteria bacterium]|nr:urate hydroxylase PuuD [Gammaproteobacteria bacterium]MDH5591493.1 urate hydroxylase PuuD [Gammaproteobacteria bacterium]
MGFIKSLLGSIKATIASGFILAILIALFGWEPHGSFNLWEVTVWLHVIFGITWIGLLYYFNFVQVPAMGEALADEGGPGPAAIGKYVAPRALLWFRMSAALTWLTGMSALESAGVGIVNAFTFADSSSSVIGLGAWFGTIMLFNVWVLIWPNQKKILGIVEATADEIAKAKVTAAMASRTNVLLSVPLLLSMTAFAHGNLI